ncbi:hypothetical protein HV417_02040 [Bacillus sporothermodurans]|uniref:phosphoesterase n=1 Tax=Heyndrickxia sporothermodurans TaxID=46224 RepID=UPI00192B8874|nr:phosphoesterase [Heyndrickxia sporothermodurans]MBL5872343.1 hypothetical protein [Heyndrickxia sporothermodurans]
MSNQEYLNAWGNIDNEEAGKGNGGNKPERPDFLKVDIGSTKVRVLDMVPYSYKEWYSTRANGGEGASIPYMGADDLLEAQNNAHMQKIFKEADAKGLKDKARKDFLRDFGYKKQPWGKVKEKHIIHVLDRATGEVKLLDKGNGIFKKLKKLALDPEYGDLRQYDITIVMTGDKNDFTTIEYDVTPARQNTPLTEAELKLYNEKKIDLVKFKTPDMTPEQALAIAKGATFKEILGNGSDSSDDVEEKSGTDMLPQDEPQDEPARKDEPVNVDKEEALSEEELNNINFG